MHEHELSNLETQLDTQAEELQLFRLPIRTVYTMFSVAAFAMAHPPNGKPHPLGASNIVGRLSHLTRFLSALPSTPIDDSALAAIEAYHAVDPAGEELRFLLGYAHFSDFMPEVHRKYYDVTRTTSGFRLDHRSPEFAKREAADILLSELALPIVVNLPKQASKFRTVFLAEPGLLSSNILGALSGLSTLYYDAIREIPLIGNETFVVASGATREEFRRFQSVLFAFSDFALVRANALLQGTATPDTAMQEALEWQTVCWNENPVLALLQVIGKLRPEIVDRLLDAFSLDFRNGTPDARHAGDGFLPPIIRLPKLNNASSLFLASPVLLRSSIQSRNILYGLLRRDQGVFDDAISHDLEPTLLAQAAKILETIPSFRVRRNIDWNGGEIDLLVYDMHSNAAAQIQAKAAIPPHGARLVARLESRVKEGLEQLDRFGNLPGSQIDAVISSALGIVVSNVRLQGVLLSRAGFGTAAYEHHPDVAFITLSQLAIVLSRFGDPTEPPSLERLLESCTTYVAEIVRRAKPYWHHEDVRIGQSTIELPLLEYDMSVIDVERQSALTKLAS